MFKTMQTAENAQIAINYLKAANHLKNDCGAIAYERFALPASEKYGRGCNTRAIQKNDTCAQQRGLRIMSLKPRKPRGLARFRKREITRAFEGVPGATSVEIFPADGRIIVHVGSSEHGDNSLDTWMAKKNVHPA